jgi:hypothetical protein
MANGTFTPKPNAFLTTMQNLFQSPQQQFSDVVGKPQARPLMPADFLTQLKGRFQNAEQMSQLKSTIGDYGKLAAGEQGYEQMPAATPEATPALSPVNAAVAAPVQANAPSPYAYQSMAQEQRDSTINELLRNLGADMTLYDGENPRDKYQDILANFATDGGATKYGMNTNIYNRWGLPEDYYRDFLIPYLQENAPIGQWPYNAKQIINAIDAEYGQQYDLRKRMMDLDRRSKGGGFMEETLNQVTKFVPGISEARMALEPIASGEHTGLDAALDISRGLIGGYVDSSGRQVSRDLGRVIPDEYNNYVSALAPIIGAIIKGPAGVIAANDIANEVTGRYESSPTESSLGSAVAGGLSYVGSQLTPSSPTVPAAEIAERFAEQAWQLGMTPSEAMQLLQNSPGLLQSLSTPLAPVAAKSALEYGSPEYEDTLKKLGMTEEQLDALPEMSTPALEPISSGLDEIFRNPMLRKVAEGALKLMTTQRAPQPSPYYFQGIPYTEGAQESPLSYVQQSPATDELTGGALTQWQMEQEKAADPNAILGSSAPFMSAAQKMEQKKNAAQILSKLRAAMREA